MAILVVLIVGLVIVLWNQSRPSPMLLDGTHTARWQGNYRYKTPTFANPTSTINIFLSSEGLERLVALVDDTRPVRNPFRILWEHLKYWANNRLFPLQISVSSNTTNHWATYYQHGTIVFLRQANPWHNTVLATDFSAEEVEAILHPFVVDSPPLSPTIPAEAELPDSNAH